MNYPTSLYVVLVLNITHVGGEHFLIGPIVQ